MFVNLQCHIRKYMLHPRIIHLVDDSFFGYPFAKQLQVSNPH